VEEVARRIPIYGPAVLRHVRMFPDPHIRLVLEGRLDEAWGSAATDLDKEEHLATCAFLGDFERVAKLVEHVPAGRRDIPLMVVCVESFRRGDHALARGLLDRLSNRQDPWTWFQLASGLLGRVPWGGYPYPDY